MGAGGAANGAAAAAAAAGGGGDRQRAQALGDQMVFWTCRICRRLTGTYKVSYIEEHEDRCRALLAKRQRQIQDREIRRRNEAAAHGHTRRARGRR